MQTLTKGRVYKSKEYGTVMYLGTIDEDGRELHRFDPAYGGRKYIQEAELPLFLEAEN